MEEMQGLHNTIGEVQAPNGVSGARGGATPIPMESSDPTTTKNWDDSNRPLTASKESVSWRRLFQDNWHQCIAYCGVFWSFGMCAAFLGPTLLDLGCLTSTDLQAISWVFFAQLLCSLVGASLAGYLVQRWVLPVICNQAQHMSSRHGNFRSPPPCPSQSGIIKPSLM